jgi:glucose/arabinose dehydrogenase
MIQGDESAPGLIPPLLHSGSDTWAPSGLAYFDSALYFGGLRGQALYRVPLAMQPSRRDPVLGLETWFKKQFGRLRDVVLGPDLYLYVTTSNRDGRGTPDAEDDKVLRINPALFAE